MAGYIQCAEWEKYEAKNILSSKPVIQNRRRDKSFPDKQKLKEYITSMPVLQEILRRALSGGTKDQKQQRLNRNRKLHQKHQFLVTQWH